MPLSYETIVNMCERTGRISLAKLQGILEKLYVEAEEARDAIEQYCQIDNLIELTLGAKSIAGDTSAYHNVAVVLARNDAFDYACDILELGLKSNPMSVDLMADYLKYGCSCNRLKTCGNIFQQLLDQQSKWNWRAYQFAIDYLLEVNVYDTNIQKEKITELVKAFVEKISDSEEAYLTKAEWLKNLSDTECVETWNGETFESVLQDVTQGKFKIKRTPKCDLKLADYYYSLGVRIEEAYSLLEQCKKNSMEIQPSVDRSYVFLLASLCKMSIYYAKAAEIGTKSAEENPELLQLVKDVYSNYHYSALDSGSMYAQNCRHLIETFVCETEIPYPYGDGINNNIQ